MVVNVRICIIHVCVIPRSESSLLFFSLTLSCLRNCFWVATSEGDARGGWGSSEIGDGYVRHRHRYSRRRRRVGDPCGPRVDSRVGRTGTAVWFTGVQLSCTTRFSPRVNQPYLYTYETYRRDYIATRIPKRDEKSAYTRNKPIVTNRPHTSFSIYSHSI